MRSSERRPTAPAVLSSPCRHRNGNNRQQEATQGMEQPLSNSGIAIRAKPSELDGKGFPLTVDHKVGGSSPPGRANPSTMRPAAVNAWAGVPRRSVATAPPSPRRPETPPLPAGEPARPDAALPTLWTSATDVLQGPLFRPLWNGGRTTGPRSLDSVQRSGRGGDAGRLFANSRWSFRFCEPPSQAVAPQQFFCGGGFDDLTCFKRD